MYPGTFAAKNPDRPALVMADTGETLTYGELEGRSVRLARVLRDAGLQKGDAVALLSENDPLYLVAYWAALRSGLYLVAINFHLTADEQAYILDDCGAAVLLSSTGQAGRAADIADRAPGVRTRLLRRPTSTGRSRRPAVPPSVTSRPAPTCSTPRAPPACPRRSGHHCATTRSTSPAHRTWRCSSRCSASARTPSTSRRRRCTTRRRCASCMVITAIGGTVVVMRRFDAEQALALIEQHRVTHSQWVPTMFVRMLKLPDDVRGRYDVSSLEVAIHAAAPCPVEVKRADDRVVGADPLRVLRRHRGGRAHLHHPAGLARAPGLGRPRALGVLHVVDEDDPDQPELPVGEDGLVYFERDVMPFAYHNDPGKTRQAQHPRHDNWATTGDIGYVDEDGYLYLTDRRAFMIICGGVNIYPQEVENALTLHPAVYDVAVIGVPDADMGEVVKAVVEPADGRRAGARRSSAS